MSLVTAERNTYEQMWALDAYAAYSPGASLVPMFLDCIEAHGGRSPLDGATVLDAGCGSGKGALALCEAGFAVTLCDLTPAGLVPEAAGMRFVQTALWEDLTVRCGYRFGGQFDYVYCCDVMEHVPPAFTMLVVRRLLDVARHGVFLNISLVPDAFGAWVGKPLHQSVQSFTAWRDQMATIAEVVEARDLLTSGVYFVRARC